LFVVVDTKIERSVVAFFQVTFQVGVGVAVAVGVLVPVGV
jgi:hypothetical protein